MRILFINSSYIALNVWCSGVSDIIGVVFSHSFGSYVSSGHRGWVRGFCGWYVGEAINVGFRFGFGVRVRG